MKKNRVTVKSNKKKYRTNRMIQSPEVRVISPNGSQQVTSLNDALSMAQSFDLDLVEIQPNAKPPVCKIIDYGKFLYEQDKRDKENKKKQKASSVKEVRFHPNTDKHDFDFKAEHAEEFLKKGDKVRATVVFLGRSIIYTDQGYDLLDRLTERLSHIAKPENNAKLEGKNLFIFYAPDNAKVAAIKRKEKQQREAEERALEEDRKERASKLKDAQERREKD